MTSQEKNNRLIHLLYVPTLSCNLGCKYCYLEGQTNIPVKAGVNFTETLKLAIQKCKSENILPYNISLHGGEVTVLKPEILEGLFSVIREHYLNNFDELSANGFKKYFPHIKTNLFNLDKHIELFKKHKVSISGSLDLPLRLHEKYRRTKNNKPTLEKITGNIKLLSAYSYSKKISATLYKEHIENPAELIDDIWYIHNELGFDMNNLNFMFGFINEQQTAQTGLQGISDMEQTLFYSRMKDEFGSSELSYGFKQNWFDEFTPNYCTNAINCGEKFILLQGDGKVYSCVRGQSDEDFYYGDIYSDTIQTILDRAKSKILSQHQSLGLNEECKACDYLYLCHTGCPYVKKNNKTSKSYTCKLQKTIYEENPVSFPKPDPPGIQRNISQEYMLKVHPNLIDHATLDAEELEVELTNELYDDSNKLLNIIEKDNILKILYSGELLKLEVDGEISKLSSQILKPQRNIYTFSGNNEISLHIHRKFFQANSKEIIRNTLLLQILKDKKVVYGDEQRLKQEHVFNFQVFYSYLSPSQKFNDGYIEVDLGKILQNNQQYFTQSIINNLFITTGQLRSYHYEKQKQNAFYHIQAINLPFQNIEFFWV